jgi:hypothetical protein
MGPGDQGRRQVRGLIAATLAAATLLGGPVAAQDRDSAAPEDDDSATGAVQQRPVPRRSPSRPRRTAEECRLLWERYRESEACFGPFRTVTGLKQEAFAVCGPELHDPASDCGPPPSPRR